MTTEFVHFTSDIVLLILFYGLRAVQRHTDSLNFYSISSDLISMLTTTIGNTEED